MKFCRKCNSSALPFFVVFFLAVGATLLHYVISCMKRHCRHGNTPEHR